jgi:pyruvate kinase
MVARGDLGVELPAHEVPLVQKLIHKQNGKNSSYCCYPNDGDNDYQFTPTRAEVNDVANSVMDGADAVIFRRTATGNYQSD